MWKLLIVDDERVPREGMVGLIPWEDYGIAVVNTATDGVDALEKIRNDPPDILLTDIRMPRMDGLELLSIVHRDYPQMDSLIISGYDEFEYAKKALTVGAKGYVLKPIDPAELLNAILDILKAKEAAADKSGGLEVYLRGSMYAHYTPEQYEAASEQFSPISGQWFRIILLQLENIRDALQEQPVSVYKRLLERIAQHVREHPACTLVEKSPHDMIVVLYGEDQQTVSAEAKALLFMLSQTLQEAHYQEFVIGVSRANQGVDRLGEMYLNTLRIINMKYLYGSGKAFYVGKRYELSGLGNRLSELIDRLVDCTLHDHPEEIQTLMATQYQQFHKAKTCLDDIQAFARSLLWALMERAAEIDLNMEDVYSDSGSIILSIFTANSRKEIMTKLTDCMYTIGQYLSEKKSVSPDKLCVEVKDYIARHLADPDMSTGTIAEALHFNASYLSAIFSATCRTTVTNHINSARMEQACHQLKTTTQRIGAIAQNCGFVHTTYFCTVFKRIVGVSPSDYRSGESGGVAR